MLFFLYRYLCLCGTYIYTRSVAVHKFPAARTKCNVEQFLLEMQCLNEFCIKKPPIDLLSSMKHGEACS